MKRILAVLLLSPLLVHAQVKGKPVVPGETGGVYVAGEGFTFEQAAEDALRERPANPGASMSVLVLARELGKVTRKSTPGAALVQKLQGAGITVYVCERDVRQGRVSPSDIAAGVRIERGWTVAEARAFVGERQAAKDSTPEGVLRRIRRLCAEG